MKRVFISSTYLDNIERRKQVEDAILHIQMLPVGMERFTARAEGVVAVSQGEVVGCDVYACIVARRYGSIDEESGLSITELEYDAAAAAHKPRLVFELDPNVPVLPEQDFDPGEDRWKKQAQLDAFKKKYRADKITPTFFRPDTLAMLVYAALNQWQGPVKAEPPAGIDSPQQLELWLQSYLPAVQSQYEGQLESSRLNPGERNNPSFELLMEEAAESSEDAGKDGEQVQPPKVWRLDEYLETVRTPLLLIGEGGSGKTTALLLAAARAAKRRLTDPGSPIPMYVDVSRVTKASDFEDVAAMLAGSIPFVADAGELSRYLAQRSQRFLILIDSFNEIATDGRRTLARSLTRFVQAQGRDHLVVIGSRKVAELDVVAKAPVGVRRCEVLRLQPDRVREHMKRYELAEKFDALPKEVQGLAGNLFMFFAIVRTLSRGKDLPTNRGTLYAQFTDGWMEVEANRRRLDYDYTRVKVPILAHLAKRMTAAGQTVMTTSPELEEDLEKELAKIYRKIERIGGMPDQWRVREFLNEVLCDGLLKDLGGQLQFLHQSVQEFYTALWFSDHQDALVEFTPRLVWDAVPTYGTVRVPEHRFVIPLLILAGLEEASPLIRPLADRHPVLAAAALASASRVDPALPSSLERSWRTLLDEPNPKLRVGLGCLIASSRITDSLVERLLDIAFEEEFDRYDAALEGLAALAAPVVLPGVLRLVQRLGDEEAARRPLDRLAEVVKRLPARAVVRALSPAWHAADQQVKERILRLRPEELKIDRETLDDAERAFVDEPRPLRKTLGASLAETIREARRRAAQVFKQAREQKLEELRSADPSAVRASLTAENAGERSAAATVAVERHLEVFDDLVEVLIGTDRGLLDFTEALVSLGGADRTIAALSDRAKWVSRRVATLPLSFETELRSRRLSKAAQAALKALGVDVVDVEYATTEDEGRSWVLTPSSWSGHRPSYEARERGEGIEVYDLNVPVRALQALLRLPDSNALRATVQVALDDEALQATVLELIQPSENSWMTPFLLDRLKVVTNYRFVRAAIEAVGRLRCKEGVALVDDLLLLGTDESPGTHPSWKPIEAYPDYRRAVHEALVSLKADEAVFGRLDHGLRDADASVRRAALAEYRQWLPDREHPDQRLRQVMTVERLKQLDQMASDPDAGVREDAARVLLVVDPDAAERSWLRRLGDADAAVRVQAARVLRDSRRGSVDVIAGLDRVLDDDIADVAISAAESLVALGAEDVYPRVRARMSAMATSAMPLELRRRASAALALLPGATQPFYAPIQRALNERRYEQAARLIDEALPIIPDDVELHWWAGHTHVALGQFEEARTSFERAAELEPSISIIRLALADTLLKLGNATAALEPARKAVSLGPELTDARVVLAWALYRTGAYDEAAASAQQALDLDPISPEAAWIVLLAGIRRRDWPSVDKPARHLRLLRAMLAPDLPTAPTDACAAEIATLRDLQPDIAQTLSELSA